MERRNPKFGYRRIAMQLANVFNIIIDKDMVRRILAKQGGGRSDHEGPSWLTFLGHMKDSLWSVDLFRAESILLSAHWVMVMIDQFTRRIIGFAVHSGPVSGTSLCCMFNGIMANNVLPTYLSSDHDPLFNFQQWQANLRVLEIEEIKTVPYVPILHPFIERLIGTIRRECLDRLLFWNENDLQKKINEFQIYYNRYRCHSTLESHTPLQKANKAFSKLINLNHYQWKTHCRGLFSLPMAA